MSAFPARHPPQPFRFLDLPIELRLIVYENIDFTTSQHVLTRSSASLPTVAWPNTPHSSQSAIFFRRSRLTVGILATSQQVRAEATPCINAKLEQLKLQPIQYLVDYPAACALAAPRSILHECISPSSSPGRQKAIRASNVSVQNFVRRCTRLLHGLQQRPTRCSRIILTIYSPRHDAALNDIQDAFFRLAVHHDRFQVPLDVLYESPIPDLHTEALATRSTLSRDEVRIAGAVMGLLQIANARMGMSWGHFKPVDCRAFKWYLREFWGVGEGKGKGRRYEGKRPVGE